MTNEIREPKQKRSIEKKEKIVDAGWKLITKNGYYKTNTAEIAKKAGVSTGIIYQYFKDKHDILISGINKYGDEVFFPMLKDTFDLSKESITNMINEYIKSHKVSKNTHEEIMSMTHSDEEVAAYFYKREMDLTNQIYNNLLDKNINKDGLKEKVHVIIGLIDNLCHEVSYHKHSELDYNKMTDIVINTILNITKTI